MPPSLSKSKLNTPAATQAERRVIMVICDSLRADLIHTETTPALARLGEAWCRYGAHRSVFPSTTRTASASIATGCLPRAHGLFGNTIALDEGEGLKTVSTGRADFRERLRAVTGRVLTRPALAERLAGHGGAVIFSNASAGAAHVQDPDGCGHLYHRDGSHGPGFASLPEGKHLDAKKGMAGDALTTGRFVEEVVLSGRGALGVLWLSEPDNTGHVVPLGGPAHREVLAAADACVTRVTDAVARIDPRGDKVLVVLASDHGQETTRRLVDVNRELVEAGLKASGDSSELVAASQGTSVLFYLAEQARERLPALLSFLEGRDWAEEIFADGKLAQVGLHDSMGLAAAVSMSKSDQPNEFGVPGFGDIMFEEGGINNVGCGQHGGNGPFEQSPFLILGGGGFPQATVRHTPSSCIDLAPTVLRHLGLPAEGMDGRPLQED